MKADELSREQRLYYEGEWREGFYVESKMRCAWAAEIEVLLEIDRICKKHGIIFVLDAAQSAGVFKIDMEELSRFMARRAPGNDEFSTSRREGDTVKFVSGITDGFTNGAPLCGIIENTNTSRLNNKA